MRCQYFFRDDWRYDQLFIYQNRVSLFLVPPFFTRSRSSSNGPKAFHRGFTVVISCPGLRPCFMKALRT